MKLKRSVNVDGGQVFCIKLIIFIGFIWHYLCIQSSDNEIGFRACSYGQKLSRLARKLFDKFTSEISPFYENNIKSYIAFI
jgi:hypothetical protein